MELTKAVRYLVSRAGRTWGVGLRVAPLMLAAVLIVTGVYIETALASSRPSVTPK